MTDLLSHIPLHLIIILGGLVLLGVVASRIPVLGTLVRVGSWVVLIVLAGLALDQRERFDPLVGNVLRRLKLEDQQVSGEEVRVRMSPDGHFWVSARLDGVERRMLVDSGATVTALSVASAAAAGIEVRDEVFPVLLRTANGTIKAKTGTLDELRFGTVVARDLPVVVSPAFGDTDVLGMNFLSMLKSWRVEGRTLILQPHHPQEVRPG
ncbi:TIGR02281 family clan AA aspartic protease [uncultured Sphingomonas sp.]|uniref:retropepsin-like aspartic protease family protein n=1 Tax=uncultured Sphingomonas sp. TaxID=158754 RepID=UPI0025D0373E|nr:TIGR02281 family clan AA aspartic protease [uncultured Sphingomonas sp.]